MDPSDVADYLKNHPEFFEHHADMLTQLQIPDRHGDRAISITERQLVALRERNRQLEAKLGELVGFGEENDTIGGKVHDLAVAMAGAGTLATVINVLYSHLGDAFLVPHVALRLWGIDPVEGRTEFSPVSTEIASFVDSLAEPYCGPGAVVETADWLGDDVQSLALIPLRRDGETFGMLALGSDDAQRFPQETGTLFLARFGDLATAGLLRTLG